MRTIKNIRNIRREHPIKILRYCALNLWLLFFPLIRSITLFPLSPEAFIGWIKGAWIDILVMLFIFGNALLRWLRCKFYFDSKCFVLIQGIILQKHIVIPFEKITATSESEIRIPFLLNLSFFRIDTTSAKASGDTILWLRKKEFEKISANIPVCRKDISFQFTYSINFWRVLLYSFLFSSSLSGTLYIAAFFIEAGNAAGEILTELHITEALSEMSSAAASVFRAVPEIIILILIILLFCRFLSFSINLLQCSGFRTSINPHIISIKSGLFPRKHTNIYFSSRECTIMKQGLLSRAAGMASMFITYPNCDKNRNKNALLVPIVSKKSPLIAFFEKNNKKSVVHTCALWCFLWQPFTIIGIILGLLFIISYIRPYTREILFPLSGIALVPAAALLLVRLIALRSQFVSWTDKKISLCYSHGLSFFTVTTENENIALIKTTRTPMARKQGYCNITIHLKGGLKAVLRGQHL